MSWTEERIERLKAMWTKGATASQTSAGLAARANELRTQPPQFSIRQDGTVDAAFGKIAVHVDGNARNTNDYKIPETRVLNDPESASGRLPHSDTRERNVGLGASYVDSWGYVGTSVSHLTNLYGIPSDEGSKIDQKQTRYDIEGLVRAPFAGFENLKFKAGHTDYEHAELGEDDAPEVIFDNRSTETRVELSHLPVAGWRGTFGIQTENTHFSALSAEGGPLQEQVEDVGVPAQVNRSSRLKSSLTDPAWNPK